jgi:hypothetical protein
MRKLEIIGLAIVAATAFGVWSASTVAQSRVGKADVLAASAPISPHAIMVKLGGAARRNTGRILTERYRGFRATCFCGEVLRLLWEDPMDLTSVFAWFAQESISIAEQAERAGAARDLHSFGVAVGDCCATVQRRSTGDAI